jgi:hypothetical protein
LERSDDARRHTDEQAFARVRAWEIREGREVRDWQAIAERNAVIDAGYDVDDV